jgi:hypothetical protein
MSWKAILRDLVLVWIFTGLGGLAIGLAFQGSAFPKGTVTAFNILLSIAAFTIAGCLVRVHRFRHIAIVALLVWLSSSVNLLSEHVTLTNWVLAPIPIFLTGAVGGAISLLIVGRPEKTDDALTPPAA